MNKITPKVGLVSLGCAKALVDSERIVTRLRAEGYELSPDYRGANVVVVNTCGFLDSARAESLSAIGEAMAENGKVIVTGCLGADRNLIRDAYPNVLSISGPQQFDTVMDAVHEIAPPPHAPYIDLLPPAGYKLTPAHYGYLKISEGCNQSCSFCIIPNLRGPLVSRTFSDVLQEAENMVASGIRELLVVSQDTGAYGRDLKHEGVRWGGRNVRTHIQDLCEALADLGVWLRLHYLYPYPHLDALIPLMADGRVLPYLDIPFQHASPAILKAMRRPARQEKLLERIASWRRLCPDLTLRSTFIVGFPGETEEDFEFLLQWLEEAQIDRLGCFRYEAVAGAAANDIAPHVPEDEKEERWQRLMARQQEISKLRLRRWVGRQIDVIVDDIDDQGIVARSRGDAPDVDGNVFVATDGAAKQGEILNVTVTETDEYDLYAVL
jgi:ribosomal protein S12 methylthiotransferase